ncbi:MAG: aspartate kinase [candidate division WOR-3 bacterium]
MNVIVQKYGGSVLTDLKAINKAAKIIISSKKSNNNVVVIVSAMGNTTDQLIKLAHKINPHPPGREKDMLLTIGERLTMALLSLAINKYGHEAISLTGSQVGIITNNEHTNARIVDIKGNRLKKIIEQGKIPIIAGFQGMSEQKEITTLGRGGSDVTAVAIAAYLKAKCCEFYKDVPGIFTEDPNIFRAVKHIDRMSYDEISELTTAGANILHPRACTIAYKNNIPIVIKSFFGKEVTTMINNSKKSLTKNEKAFVRAITHSYDLCRLTLVAVPKLPKCLHQVIVKFAEAKVPILFFAHGIPYQNKFDLSFIIHKSNFKNALSVIKNTALDVNAEKYIIAKNLASVSLIGAGIGNDIEINSKLFEVLHKMGIHIDAFTVSETKITFFLKRKDAYLAIKTLLKKFNLLKNDE